MRLKAQTSRLVTALAEHSWPGKNISPSVKKEIKEISLDNIRQIATISGTITITTTTTTATTTTATITTLMALTKQAKKATMTRQP